MSSHAIRTNLLRSIGLAILLGPLAPLAMAQDLGLGIASTHLDLYHLACVVGEVAQTCAETGRAKQRTMNKLAILTIAIRLI